MWSGINPYLLVQPTRHSCQLGPSLSSVPVAVLLTDGLKHADEKYICFLYFFVNVMVVESVEEGEKA